MVHLKDIVKEEFTELDVKLIEETQRRKLRKGCAKVSALGGGEMERQ